MDTETPRQRIPIRELVRYYLRLGLVGFGGPVALVGQMERGLVGERKNPDGSSSNRRGARVFVVKRSSTW